MEINVWACGSNLYCSSIGVIMQNAIELGSNDLPIIALNSDPDIKIEQYASVQQQTAPVKQISLLALSRIHHWFQDLGSELDK
jgi:hypothetical protein